MEMPEGIEFWTADEVAECLGGLSNELCAKLWRILNDSKNPTPSGGDGGTGWDGRVTVETPDARLDLDNDDKATYWWPKLSEDEQKAITEAYRRETGR